jgi:hypothetical protein
MDDLEQAFLADIGLGPNTGDCPYPVDTYAGILWDIERTIPNATALFMDEEITLEELVNWGEQEIVKTYENITLLNPARDPNGARQYILDKINSGKTHSELRPTKFNYKDTIYEIENCPNWMDG